VKEKYRNKYYNNNHNFKYHVNKLLDEFLQFMKYKNFIEFPIEPIPIEVSPIKDLQIEPMVIVTRERRYRNSKADAKVPGYAACIPTYDTEGRKKKVEKMLGRRF